MTRRGGAWRRERDSDAFVREARQRGLRSRAALKLEAIDARDHLFRNTRTVVDLGAAPGGWSQIARRALPPGGRIVALDLLEMEPLAGVEFIRGDFRCAEVVDRVEAMVGRRAAGLVMSDMAPNLSGMRVNDQARWRELAESAARFAGGVLTDDGVFLVKLFQGEETAAYLESLRERFTSVAVRKPAASRKRSSEAYALARGVRPARMSPRIAKRGCGDGGSGSASRSAQHPAPNLGYSVGTARHTWTYAIPRATIMKGAVRGFWRAAPMRGPAPWARAGRDEQRRIP